MYSEIIQQLIIACQWDTTDYLVISQNVFDPFIYYSHLVPLILSLTIGFFILYKNRHLLLTKILFTITCLFSLWVFFDLILWATDRPDYVMFFWALLVLIEPLIYAAGVYFIQVFISGKDTTIKNKLLILIPLIPIFLLVSTDYALLGYNLANCDREAIEGPLAQYEYLVEIFYTLWIVMFAMENLRKKRLTASTINRKQIILITTGILLFLLSLSAGNLIGTITNEWRIAQWGLFGMPVFIAFLAYLIVKYKTFDIKLIATQALVVTLSALIGSQFFFIRSSGNRIINAITFAIAVFAGTALVRSVKKEVTQREQIEKLAKQLEKTNVKLEKTNVQLNEANVKLKDLDRQKTEFLSIASHQLRSPITAIKGYASMVLEGSFGAIAGEMKEAVNVIYLSCQKMATVIEDFLDITRIELGKMKYDFVPANLREIAESVVKQMQPVAEVHKLKLSFTAQAGSDYALKADIGKLTQVINNLVDNAVKYTKEGSIDVLLTKAGPSTKLGASKYILTVKDTGVGMDKKTIESLFQKFNRADGSKLNVTGTGLGLYVAKQLTEAHGGTLRAESGGAGHGSQFIVELPMKRG